MTEENWSGADLQDVIAEALEPFGQAQSQANRIVARGANVRLPPKAVLALSLGFNELATNAAKYGALSNAEGTVLIEWAIEPSADGPRLILQWQEKHGPLVTPPSRNGFGTRMIKRGLAHELEGVVRLDYRPDGLVCTINIPLPKATRDE